jgi:hypothetical protein
MTRNEIADRLGLHPLYRPNSDDSHHTDQAMTKHDHQVGEHLAFYLGTLFSDVNWDTYFRTEMTSADLWSRVARALRVHGLKVVDAEGS